MSLPPWQTTGSDDGRSCGRRTATGLGDGAPAGSRSTSSIRRGADLDRLAILEEERDHLLASMRDLDRELAAGDIDATDHATLRDGYTVRTAEVLREIDVLQVRLGLVPDPAALSAGRLTPSGSIPRPRRAPTTEHDRPHGRR